MRETKRITLLAKPLIISKRTQRALALGLTEKYSKDRERENEAEEKQMKSIVRGPRE